MQGTLTHQTYKFVSEEEADASAWIFTSAKEDMTKVYVKLPELRAHELRIKITYTGLCHTDLHHVRGDWGPSPYPIAPGHEIVGEVTHVGSDVKDFKVGDKVGYGPIRESCGTCKACTSGVEQLCRNPSLEQHGTYGPKFWGGYATHTQQPADWCFKIPSNLPENKVPPLLCAGVTAYAPIARYAKPGQEIAVLGIGGLGHMAIQYGKAWGCKVTAFTSSPEKEEFIKKLGADRVVISSPETLKQEAGKYDLILNTLNVTDDFRSYILLASVCGTLVQLGMPAFGKAANFNPILLAINHVNFTGSGAGSRKEIKEMLEFSAKHNIVSTCEEFEYEKFPEALDRLEHGKPIFRCVVDVCKHHK